MINLNFLWGALCWLFFKTWPFLAGVVLALIIFRLVLFIDQEISRYRAFKATYGSNFIGMTYKEWRKGCGPKKDRKGRITNVL